MTKLKFRAFAYGVNEMTFFDNLIVATGELSEGKAWGMFFPSANGKIFLGGYSDPMQFTGLIDANGMEIYEGDILRWPNGTAVSNPVTRRNDGMFECGKHGESLHFCISAKMCVIGNKFQNPELLT